MWDGSTVRNTRQGRSIRSIQAQVDRALGSTQGTDTYYRNYRRLLSIAQRYNENINRVMDVRAANNPNALNSALAKQLRDPERERRAMVGRSVYESGVSQSAKAGSNG